MISPLILYYVMRFLEDRDNDDYLRGSLLVMALLCSQFVAFFIFEHTFLYAVVFDNVRISKASKLKSC